MTTISLEKILQQPFKSSDLPLPGKRAGKVRDIYKLPDHQLLLVTTDRLSAFDCILGHVPYKGQVLNQLAAWWFESTRHIIPNHFLQSPDPNAMIAVPISSKPLVVWR